MELLLQRIVCILSFILLLYLMFQFFRIYSLEGSLHPFLSLSPNFLKLMEYTAHTIIWHCGNCIVILWYLKIALSLHLFNDDDSLCWCNDCCWFTGSIFYGFLWSCLVWSPAENWNFLLVSLSAVASCLTYKYFCNFYFCSRGKRLLLIYIKCKQCM